MTMYGLRHPLLARTAAGTALTALLAGIPAVLLIFFWPIDLPTLDDLATPGEPIVIRTLLLATVWICWALFAFAVTVELVGTVRAQRSQVRLPFQRLAAYLITTITVAATAPIAAPRALIPAAAVTLDVSDHAPAAEPDQQEGRQPYVTYVVQPRDTLWTIAEQQLGDPMRYRDIIALNQGRTLTDGQPFTRGEWLQPGCVLRLPADAGKPEHARPRTHTVASGETLWGISEQHLGKGTRYKKIFKLNRGRPQPGGARLTDPDVLEPGWRLILPRHGHDAQKAKPVHRRTLTQHVIKTALYPADHHPAHPATTGASSPRPVAEPGSCRSTPSPAPPAPAPAAADVVVLPQGGMMALSFASGVAVALAATRLHRRRRLPAPSIDEPISVLTPEPQHPAVRALEQAHRQANPETEPDFDLVSSAFEIDPPVTLKAGTRDDKPVYLTLSGLNLALTGPGADDCIRATVLDLLTQADAYRADVIIPIPDAERWFGDTITTLIDHLPGLRLTTTLDEAINHLEEQLLSRRVILQDYEADDIHQLRQAEPGEPLPALLLAASSPDGHPYLSNLLTMATNLGIGAVLAGHSPSGTTCELDQTHHITEATGPLAADLRDATLFHLPPEAATSVLHTLATGNGLPTDHPEQPADLPIPSPSTTPQPVRFTLLGEPAIDVRGTPVDLSKRTKALELFVLLALHPKGLDREEICEHLWPDLEETLAGYRFHAALKDLRIALRDASAPDDKKAHFIERAGKTYRIEAQHIHIDLWTFHQALADARTATTEQAKLAALETAATLCRGPLTRGLKYDWLDQDHRWPLTIASVKALLQLGALHERAGHHERALETYDQACALDPDMESATRSAIRLLTTLGRTDEARQHARHLKTRLNALGATPSPETQTVLQQLNAPRNAPRML
ncbi:LysM peptidoglycan-binding domain-containing protein [Nonomuraea glycinis]|uniref:LysM peptidoglycan-binding domain-containing protein n=1 Tax=Nonomuraea glycinis TaxID=2047744 RepID=UPI0016638B01|nr:LysM peptidoglycan-binding domain-containing protein [Nonomuraea glycinis]MCA2178484.1 LysM peptidoglycan-binding domain-containing protein [Nonomuraea glycinis]